MQFIRFDVLEIALLAASTAMAGVAYYLDNLAFSK
jgi:hypothetical protein